MTKSNTNVSTFTTLSESELFNRFLDAPYREGGLTSLSANEKSECTMLERYFSYGGFDTECLPDDLPEFITDTLRNCDDPIIELDAVIGAFEAMARSLHLILNSFEELARETRTEAPSEDATDEEHRKWEENPRYVLAETERSAA
ncbi:hypothetical protein [Sulfitobacter pontiacus]|uniref:hypothetical protein n=1 Tax=Sulfitobacter pontiacus TaxID=60137 RepID=UPI0030EC2A24